LPSILDEVEKTGKEWHCDAADAEGNWYFMRALPYRIGTHATSGFVLTFIDIHPVKAAEADRDRLLGLLNETQALARVGGWEWDVEGKAMYWTRETYRLHGLEPESIDAGSSKHVERSLECYPPKDREAVQAAFGRCCEDGTPYDLRVDFTNFKGERMKVRTVGRAVRREGRIAKVVGNLMDVTNLVGG
jgi:PAS domain-containing protein